MRQRMNVNWLRNVYIENSGLEIMRRNKFLTENIYIFFFGKKARRTNPASIRKSTC